MSLPNLLHGAASAVVWSFIFAFCLFLSACRPPSEQVRNSVGTALQSCLIDVSELPDGWKVSESPRTASPLDSPYIDSPVGGTMIEFVHVGQNTSVPAVQHLSLFKTRSQAITAFRKSPVFTRIQTTGLWKELDISATTTLAADNFFLACVESRSDSGVEYKDCTSTARYDRVFTSFSSLISSEYMSVEEMIQVLQAIDRNILQCIDSFVDKEWVEE